MNRTAPPALEPHRRAVYALCFKVLRHAQDAEDAAQEALLEAAREGQAVRDPARFEAWLQRVALHTALDVLRRRRTRERHEGRVPPPAERARDGRAEALYAALAGLPEEDRRVLVERFIHEKTLREMAGPEGCSEVAVWKRIGRAKRRLREALAMAGAGAAFALLPREGFGATGVPAGGVKLALAAAAVVVVAAGVAARMRDGENAPPARAVGRAPASVEPAPDRAEAASRPSPSVGPEAPPSPAGAAARPPYPYRFPPPRWGPGLAASWQALRGRRVVLDVKDEPLEAVLAELTRQTGVRFTPAPDVPAQMISMKVKDVILEGTLRLILGPRELGFELLEDGSIRVDREDRSGGRLAGEARGIEDALRALEEVRARLEAGWNGIDFADPVETLEAGLRTRPIVSRQQDATFMDRISFLRESTGANIYVDPSIGEELLARLRARRPLPVEEATPEEHLARSCADAGLGFAVTSAGVVLVTSRELAEESRTRLAEDRADRAERLARLDRRLEAALPGSMPDLAASLERALGLTVIVSERVWESGREFAIPAGLTAREALSLVASQGGFRWGLDRRLYIVD